MGDDPRLTDNRPGAFTSMNHVDWVRLSESHRGYLAIILAQHLDPSHPSLLAEFRGEHSPMQVVDPAIAGLKGSRDNKAVSRSRPEGERHNRPDGCGAFYCQRAAQLMRKGGEQLATHQFRFTFWIKPHAVVANGEGGPLSFKRETQCDLPRPAIGKSMAISVDDRLHRKEGHRNRAVERNTLTLRAALQLGRVMVAKGIAQLAGQTGKQHVDVDTALARGITLLIQQAVDQGERAHPDVRLLKRLTAHRIGDGPRLKLEQAGDNLKVVFDAVMYFSGQFGLGIKRVSQLSSPNVNDLRHIVQIIAQFA